MTAENVVPDQELLAARAQARSALEEITDARSIGGDAGHEVHEEHVVTLFFESNMSGYPGWRWAATLAKVNASAEVNVLEVELLPGETAVVAPDWVPWSERLAQFREAKALGIATGFNAADDAEAEAALAAAAELGDDDDAEDNVLDNDFSDFDDEMHGIDVDDDEDDDDEGDDEDEADEAEDEFDDSDDSDDDADESDDDSDDEDADDDE